MWAADWGGRAPLLGPRSSSICSRECAKDNWSQHKPVCRDRQAVKMGKDWARAENRAVTFTYAALDNDTRRMQELIDGLEEAVTANKKLTKHSAAAVKAFVNFQDPREAGNAAFGSAQGGALKAMRLLHERGADLDLGATQQTATPSAIAAQFGRTAAIALGVAVCLSLIHI